MVTKEKSDSYISNRVFNGIRILDAKQSEAARKRAARALAKIAKKATDDNR